MDHPLPRRVAENPTQYNINAIAKLEHDALEPRTVTERVSDLITKLVGNVGLLLAQVILISSWSHANLQVISPKGNGASDGPAHFSAGGKALKTTTGPVFTYPSGPKGCTQPTSYPDAALCTIPNEMPLATFAVPAVGGTYVDANFGSTIKVLSGFASNHAYSSPTALSATGKYVAVNHNGSQVNVVNTATGAVVYTSRPGSLLGDNIRWDAANDEVYYYTSGAALMKHVLSSNKTTTVTNYATDGHGFSVIGFIGTGGVSSDNWTAFVTQTDNAFDVTRVNNICAVNLNAPKTYCANFTKAGGTLGYTFIDFANIAKGVDSVSGKRYVI